MARLFSICVRATALAVLACPPGIAAAQDTPDPAPRANLSGAQLTDFYSGLALFKRDLTPADDPRNEDQCSDCHFRPAVGGSGFVYHGAVFYSFTYDRPSREIGIDRWPADRTEPGPKGAHVVDANEDAPIPVWANAVSRRLPRMLFGIGSLEQIPQAAILAHADVDDGDRDGISGRALGRYGSQGQFTSIDSTIRTVISDELGVAPANVRSEDVRLIGAFLRGLRDPIVQPNPSTAGIEGQATFANIGCAECHTPSYTLPTGRTIQPYSDFLVHDMGSCLDDGVSLSDAATYEWRTPPLWTIGDNNSTFLHDGRGGRLDQFVVYHCGEARTSRDAYLSLPQKEQVKVRAFLRQLVPDYSAAYPAP